MHKIMHDAASPSLAAPVASSAPPCDRPSTPGTELAGYLNRLFAIADKNGGGVLQMDEHKKLMGLTGLKFPEAVAEQHERAERDKHGCQGKRGREDKPEISETIATNETAEMRQASG